MRIVETLTRLIESVSAIETVRSVGKSGGAEINDGDVDIYVFCDEIPNIETRRAAVIRADGIEGAEYSESQGKFWGVIDFFSINETEVCLMYFTCAYMDDEIESVLRGERLDKEQNFFYPTGRCATMLSTHAYYDETDYVAGWKNKLSVYPESLFIKLFNYHINKSYDAESFERAVSRKDLFFYHSVLDSALDHFLQALFALNKTFFPSRKRTKEYIEAFAIKPTNCNTRLERIIEAGSRAETLAESRCGFLSLHDELKDLSIKELNVAPE